MEEANILQMKDKKRRAMKWKYLEENLPELAIILRDFKAENITFTEPLLFVNGKPVDSYTRDFMSQHRTFR